MAELSARTPDSVPVSRRQALAYGSLAAGVAAASAAAAPAQAQEASNRRSRLQPG